MRCDNAKCVPCFNNSFASHEKSKYWSDKNGDVKPRDVSYCNGNKYWFDCNKCNHSFDTALSHIVNGSWCPYCSVPPKQLCNNVKCDDCFKKSFAFHPKSQFWSKTKNGDAKPRDVFQYTPQKYWFDCDKYKHTFDAALSHIVNGRWCPYCKNKTEQKLYDAVKPLYPTLINQFKQEWCKNITYLPFDLCIPNHNIIIELDGAQHFRQVSNWTSPEDTFKNDLFKEKCANDNGYSVIRILQEDVFGDKYDWLSNLQTEIENIIKDDTIIHNIYMCENGEYDNFILE
jgi:very-short-patch-repair endonuclease